MAAAINRIALCLTRQGRITGKQRFGCLYGDGFRMILHRRSSERDQKTRRDLPQKRERERERESRGKMLRFAGEKLPLMKKKKREKSGGERVQIKGKP